MQLSHEQIHRLADAPVGHLSTAGKAVIPHVIPVCFALDSREDNPAIYIALDGKPKRAALTRLRRVRNILENPQVALVVDHYEEDWTKLWYILVTGSAELLEGNDVLRQAQDERNHVPPVRPEPVHPVRPEPVEGRNTNDERSRAIRLLREKYPQYREMDIDENPVIKINLGRAVAWSYTPETGF